MNCPNCGKPSMAKESDSTTLKLCHNHDCRVATFHDLGK